MAKIQPQSIWKDGKIYQADEIIVSIVSDNLLNSALFYYKLSEAPVETIDKEKSTITYSPGTTIADGNVGIDGEDYEEWGKASDINLWAYQYVASKLNLTLA